MQYKGFEIQNTQEGYIIRNSYGDYIAMVENDSEAYDYIDDMDEEDAQIAHKQVDYYKQFSDYCKRLPGRCYPTSSNEFGTTNFRALKRFIKPFENATNTTVITRIEYIGGELFYIVEDVVKN